MRKKLDKHLETQLNALRFGLVNFVCPCGGRGKERCRIWLELTEVYLGLSPSQFHASRSFGPLDCPERFVELLTQSGEIVPGSERFTSLNVCLAKALVSGVPDMIDYFIRMSDFDPDRFISHVALSNDVTLVCLFFENVSPKGRLEIFSMKDRAFALVISAMEYRKVLDFVDRICEQLPDEHDRLLYRSMKIGSDVDPDDFEDKFIAIMAAIVTRRQDIFLKMLEKPDRFVLSGLARVIAMSGFQELIDLIWNRRGECLPQMIEGFSASGRLDLLKQLPIEEEHVDFLFSTATWNRQIDIVKFFLPRFKECIPWERAVTSSVIVGDLELLEFYLENVPENFDGYELAMINAIIRGRLDLAKRLLPRIDDKQGTLFALACSQGKLDIALEMSDKYPQNLFEAGILSAVDNGQRRLFERLYPRVDDSKKDELMKQVIDILLDRRNHPWLRHLLTKSDPARQVSIFVGAAERGDEAFLRYFVREYRVPVRVAMKLIERRANESTRAEFHLLRAVLISKDEFPTTNRHLLGDA